jgi:hypothetical protein
MIIRELEVTLASPPFFPLEEVKLSRIDAVKEPCYVSTWIKKIKRFAKLENAPAPRKKNLIPKDICWYNRIMATLIYLRKHIYSNTGTNATFLSITYSDPVMKMVTAYFYFSWCAIWLALLLPA